MMNKIYTLFFLGTVTLGSAQVVDKKESDKALKSSMDLTWEANKELSENEFIQAEADYRRAISKSDENVIAPYNLGTAYYKKESLEEAFGRFKQAGELAEAKPEKHKAFHNMGNVFMKNEEYSKAVEAYKEALRNDPTDEETRYNLALAKALAEKQKNQQKDGEDEDKDKKENEDQEQDKENKEDQEDNQDKDGGDKEKDDNKEGDGEKKKEQPEQGEKPEEQKQPKPNQLSPQQVKNLLEAMQNEENKVQEKMNEKKVKGPKSKNAKDW